MPAIDLEPLIQRAELHAGQFFAELRLIEQALVRTDRASTVTAARMRSSFSGVLPAIASVRAGITALAGALAVRQVIAYADAYTNVQNRLRVAGVASEDMAAATAEIFDIAQRTRTPVGELAQLYARVSLASDSLGISQRETAEFTELVGRAIAAAGSTSGEAAGALLQLSQALGGSVIQMQEFNSLIDGARPLLQAAAAGILEAGGSVDKLRQMVLQGRLSGEEFFQGIQAGAHVINTQFASTVPTVRQAMTNLNTALTEFVGSTDQSAGGSRALAQAIQDLADVLGSEEFQTFAQDTIGAIGTGVQRVIAFFDAWEAATNRVQAALAAVGAQGLGDMLDMNLFELANKTLERTVELLQQLEESRGAPLTLGDVTSGPAQFGAGLGAAILQTDELTEAQREAKTARDELFGPFQIGWDLGDTLVQMGQLSEAQRELAGVQEELATARGRRSELLAGMNEDLNEMVERLDEARAKLVEMQEGGADPERTAEQQALVAKILDEIEQRGLSNVALTQQEELLARLIGREQELLGLVEQEAAARQRAAGDATARAFIPQFDEELAPRFRAGPPQPISAGDPERGTGTGRRKTTFQDIIGPVQEQLALLQETELTENRISEIISAQSRLKKDLSAAQREALVEANTALDVELERREIAAEVDRLHAEASAGGRETEALRIQVAHLNDMAEGGREYADALSDARREQEAAASALQVATMAADFEEQAEQSRLLAQYGGQQTEHYRIHLALLQARLQLGRELEAQETQMVELSAEAAAHAERRARTATTMTELRQRRERFDFQSSQAGALAEADITGLPPSQEVLAAQTRFDIQQDVGRGRISPQEAAALDPMVDDLARAEQHMILMNETAPALAGSLADLGSIALFEGWEEAGERFVQMVVEMIIQLAALRIVMAGMSAFGVGAQPGAVPPPGVGPGGTGFLGTTQGMGASGWGGPRQHGGRVRQGSAYLVGEAGPEMFVPDSAGRVASGSMAAGGGGAPNVTVNVSNNVPGAQVTADRSRTGVDGRPIVDLMVADSLDRMHGGGQLDRMLGGRRTGTRRS